MSTTITSTGAATVRRGSWGSIFAGTVVALALPVIFTRLGLAIGAAAVDPLYESNLLAGLVLIWAPQLRSFALSLAAVAVAIVVATK